MCVCVYVCVGGVGGYVCMCVFGVEGYSVRWDLSTPM